MDPRVETHASAAESLDRSTVSGAAMLRLAMLAGVAVGLGVLLPRTSSPQPPSGQPPMNTDVGQHNVSVVDPVINEPPAR
ncbi:MAG: hypothetical protein AAGI53_07870 [Planctomycetota bacterium]